MLDPSSTVWSEVLPGHARQDHPNDSIRLGHVVARIVQTLAFHESPLPGP
jgi:hypothetical protein